MDDDTLRLAPTASAGHARPACYLLHGNADDMKRYVTHAHERASASASGRLTCDECRGAVDDALGPGVGNGTSYNADLLERGSAHMVDVILDCCGCEPPAAAHREGGMPDARALQMPTEV